MLPRYPWSLQFFAVWNSSARIRLNEDNPIWFTDRAQDIPGAHWWKTSIDNDPILNARNPDNEARFKKYEKLLSDLQHTPKNIVQSNDPSCHKPRLAQIWVAKLKTGKSGHTRIAAAVHVKNKKKEQEPITLAMIAPNVFLTKWSRDRQHRCKD
eukprot:1142024-Pelagomonas_calceolata.AAC.2